MDNKKTESFMYHDAWKEARKLVLRVYKIIKGFSKEEMFELVSPIRRRAVFMTPRIAEGFNRQSYKGKYNFIQERMDRLQYCSTNCLFSEIVNYAKKEGRSEITEQAIKVYKIMKRFMNDSQRYVI